MSVPPGQLASPVEWIADPNPPASDPKREFAAQRERDGRLVLTASNGFFDGGIRAAGSREPKDAGSAGFIDPEFGWLELGGNAGLTVRWHLWVEQPGALSADFHLTTGAGDAGATIAATLDGKTRILTTRAVSDPEQSQGAPLAFTVEKAGWHTLTLRLDARKGRQFGRLHRIELTGPGITKAAVLRARWRPAACHTRFSCGAVKAPLLWVMTTRASDLDKAGSYSPVTTPFGYYGCSIGADGRISGSANFSLWSYGGGKPSPQERWSHLLAVGSPHAAFGSFGHEGCGVKVRDWSPFGSEWKEVTLALRGERAGEWMHWFGYFLDPQSARFRLYAAGASWIGKRGTPGLYPGAFVEQPGPPHVQRSGDLVRDVQRRGWVLDEKKQWHWLDTMKAGTGRANKHWRVTEDGWFAMGMGGMAHREGPGGTVTLDSSRLVMPSWLNDQAARDLLRLPATIGPRRISDVTRDSARIAVDLTGLDLQPGEQAKATVYHGPEDGMTFATDLGYRGVKTRIWAHHSEPLVVRDGANTVTLTGLSPGTKHYFRLLVERPRGRVWSFATDSFDTLP
jgi:hypothetical protein